VALSRFRSRLAAGLVIAFTAALLFSLVTYIHRDGRPLTYDDAYYLETSLRLYHRLAMGGLAEFLAGYTEAFGIRAPLIAVLPAPFFWAFGPELDSALLINAVFLVLINLYLYRLAVRWYGRAVGVLAVVVFQTMPIAIGMSRAFMTEYGLTALSICFLYYLVRSERLSNGTANLNLGIVGGLGMLMKINFLFVLVPVAVTLYYRRRHGHPEPEKSAAFVPRMFTQSPVGQF
jgi:4-amino-4-deoxy-L-arabinose transferase-like glycosyltransferase